MHKKRGFYDEKRKKRKITLYKLDKKSNLSRSTCHRNKASLLREPSLLRIRTTATHRRRMAIARNTHVAVLQTALQIVPCRANERNLASLALDGVLEFNLWSR